jgi:hypothetical protein
MVNKFVGCYQSPAETARTAHAMELLGEAFVKIRDVSMATHGDSRIPAGSADPRVVGIDDPGDNSLFCAVSLIRRRRRIVCGKC